MSKAGNEYESRMQEEIRLSAEEEAKAERERALERAGKATTSDHPVIEAVADRIIDVIEDVTKEHVVRMRGKIQQLHKEHTVVYTSEHFVMLLIDDEPLPYKLRRKGDGVQVGESTKIDDLVNVCQRMEAKFDGTESYKGDSAGH